jgi:DNA-damage-inducible protein D
MDNQLAIFEQKPIRRMEHEGEIWFSIVNIISVLTDSPDPKNYWSKLKERNSQTLTVRQSLRVAADHKMRKTDCATTKGCLGLSCLYVHRR